MSGSSRRHHEGSIVPRGFRCTAHPVFLDYIPPCVEIEFSSSPECQNENSENNSKLPLAPSHQFAQEDYCSICLCPYSTPVTLLLCCHSFCRDCALVWFRKKSLCPLCKSSAQYFVQSKNVSGNKSPRDLHIDSAGDDTDIRKYVKVWAIYEHAEQLQDLVPIRRSQAAPAIRKHVERFITDGVDRSQEKGSCMGHTKNIAQITQDPVLRMKRKSDTRDDTRRSVTVETCTDSTVSKYDVLSVNSGDDIDPVSDRDDGDDRDSLTKSEQRIYRYVTRKVNN